jgi:hypothetical protein
MTGGMAEPAMFAAGAVCPMRTIRARPRLDSCITHMEMRIAFRRNVRAASFAALCGPHRAAGNEEDGRLRRAAGELPVVTGRFVSGAALAG